MAPKKGLGKGLESLIPTNAVSEQEEVANNAGKNSNSKSLGTKGNTKATVAVEASETNGPSIQTVKITDIEPNPDQPRKTFEEDPLQELSDSIKEYGIIDPIIVTKKNNFYQIIAGERRWRAARIAGLKEVPVIVREYTEQEIAEISLIENIQRENLNPIEEALAYQKLIQDFSLKQDELAERVAKSRTAITNTMRLLKLCEKVQQMLIDEQISSGHARALLAIENPELQYDIACTVFDERLSVRQTEALVKKCMNDSKAPVKKPVIDHSALYTATEEQLKDILGSKVTIKAKDNQRGRIEIEYYTVDELDGLIDMLKDVKKN